MSELTLVFIRLAFLAILWIFVFSAISVIRTDMFGARVPATGKEPERGAGKKQKKTPKVPKVSRRGTPTQLVVASGANAGEAVSLEKAPIVIGRGADAQIILDDDYVSTRHARVAVSGDQWFVEDLGSTNGTYIGSVRLTQPTAISIGTQVRIGKTIVELRK